MCPLNNLKCIIIEGSSVSPATQPAITVSLGCRLYPLGTCDRTQTSCREGCIHEIWCNSTWLLMWSQLSQCSQLSQSTTIVATPTTIVAKNHNCRNANHNCRNSAQPQLSQRQSQMSQFFRNFIFSFLISILYNYGILSHLLWSLHHFLLYSQ